MTIGAANLTPADAERLRQCVVGDGVAVFPADTVYGVCCDPDSDAAARRLYALKGYSPSPTPARAAAVMFFALELALETLTELHDAEQAALDRLLPGPVTLLLPNRTGRFAPACGPDPATIGVRVPRLPDPLAPLRSVGVAVMQSSANLHGQPDARVLAAVPTAILSGADLVLDGGELPGVASTVIDLRAYAARGQWHVVREGELSTAAVRSLLSGSI
jgi:L-threonylcarbamoyladenylate synthase